MQVRGEQSSENRGERPGRCVSFKDDTKAPKKKSRRPLYTAVDPEEDDYDPTKPEFVSPASREQVEEANRQLVEQQIARLESTLVKRRALKPGLLHHYERVLSDMTESISPEGSPRGSFRAAEDLCGSDFNSPVSFYSEDGFAASRRRHCNSDEEEEEERGRDEWVLTGASPRDCDGAAPAGIEDGCSPPSQQDFDSSFSTGAPSEELAEKACADGEAEETPSTRAGSKTSWSRPPVHRCEDDASTTPRMRTSAPASLESIIFAKLGRALVAMCRCVA